MLIGVDRIKDIYFSARTLCRDCTMQNMERDWYRVFDYSLQVLKERLDKEHYMSDEIYGKIMEVQQRETGITQKALDRFGPDGGRTDQVPNSERAWI